jgi:integrase
MPGNEVVEPAPGHALRRAAAGEHVQRLAAAAAAYAEDAQSASTRRAYQSSWRTFAAFCASIEQGDLPASAGAVALFLADLAPHRSVSTLSLHLAAIRDRHERAGLPAPASAELALVWDGIRNRHGRRPNRKRALTTQLLRKCIAKLPATRAGLRDRALLLIQFAGALRRSEVTALEIASDTGVCEASRVEFWPEGVLIVLVRSKSDQRGESRQIPIPMGKTALCPVAALRAWLSAADIRSGPVFRAVDRHDRVLARRLDPGSVARIIKRTARAGDLDPAVFSGHSPRAGLATSAAAAKVPMAPISQHMRHSKVETTMVYIREVEMFKTSPAGRVGL